MFGKYVGFCGKVLSTSSNTYNSLRNEMSLPTPIYRPPNFGDSTKGRLNVA